MSFLDVIGVIATGASALGVGVGTKAAYNRSSGERAGYRAQADVMGTNAQLARWQADDALRRGATEVQRVQLNTAQLKGKQRAALAASGVDLGEGSALNILTDTDFMGARDANTAQLNAEKEAYGYGVQSSSYAANARVLAARADSESPLMAAAGTFLSGAGTVAARWYDLHKSPGKSSGDYSIE